MTPSRLPLEGRPTIFRRKISGGGRCTAASLISAIVYLFLCTAAFAAGEPPLVIKSGQTQQLPTADTLQLRNITGSTQCAHADTSGNITGTGADCGTVTTTGAPASGNITKFSGATSVTNGDISGDCTTSGTLAVTCLKTNGTNFGDLATRNAATPPAIGGTTPAAGSFSSLKDTGIASGTQCVHADSSGNLTGTGSDCATVVEPYIVSFGLLGAPLANSQATYVLFQYAVTFPANFGAITSGQSSGATGTANATASTAFSIDKRTANPNTFGTNVGSITIGAGGITATLATAGGTSYTTAAGELWRIIGPATADATFANLVATLVGTR